VPTLWRGLYGRPYLLLTLTTLMWGGNSVASRLAVGHISPMVLTSLRWTGVCLVLVPLMAPQLAAARRELMPRWRYVFVMSALGFTSFNALMYAAAHYTSAINISIVQGAIPIFVLLGGLAWFGDRIGGLQALGTAVTLVGIVVIAAEGDLARLAGMAFNIGDVWMVIACTTWTIYTLGLRKRPNVSGFVLFTALACAGLVLSLPLLGYEIATGTALWPDAVGLIILLYVALMPSLLSQVFYMRGVELIGSARAGLFVNLVPIFGPLLAVVILGEPFHLHHALALGLVLGGIWLAERRR
jgi:drug/metabolite transporter (DMT)-like permease